MGFKTLRILLIKSLRLDLPPPPNKTRSGLDISLPSLQLLSTESASSSIIVDFVRSYSPGFIFTTSIPPAIAAGAIASVRYVKNNSELRKKLNEKCLLIKERLLRVHPTSVITRPR